MLNNVKCAAISKLTDQLQKSSKRKYLEFVFTDKLIRVA